MVTTIVITVIFQINTNILFSNHHNSSLTSNTKEQKSAVVVRINLIVERIAILTKSNNNNCSKTSTTPLNPKPQALRGCGIDIRRRGYVTM